MQHDFTEGEFYQANFEAAAYLTTYYSSETGNAFEGSQLSFTLSTLCQAFASGHITGKLLIEIGSGPTLHNALIASEYFQEIIMSDYTECNRKEIEKWLRRESGAYDWSHVSKFICDIEGKRSTIEEREEKTRSVIKQVLKCDVTQINPFHPIVLEPADCLLTSLCLEVACKDQEAYQNALGNIATLLKPGGTLIMIGVLKETFYRLGKYKYSCLCIDQNFVKSALQKQGFVIQKFEAKPGPDKATNIMFDFEEIFVLVAQKTG
uniref:Zgc:64002 n=1 Tax=Erpetoichthys calabaricus TaxID=27687 RepID=A0A8C4SX19_ERPCA